MMEQKNTRERALDAALALFSQKGYEGVTLGDVAQALGIKPPSLYKYFPSKEGLYRALLDRLRAGHDLALEELGRQEEKMARELLSAGLLSEEALVGEAVSWMEKYLQKPEECAWRRIMTLGQYGDPDLADALTQWEQGYVTLWEGTFGVLIDGGVLRRGDPHVMAVQFTAPVLRFAALADRDPGQREEALEEVRRHARLFHRIFAVREQPKQGGRPWRR